MFLIAHSTTSPTPLARSFGDLPNDGNGQSLSRECVTGKSQNEFVKSLSAFIDKMSSLTICHYHCYIDRRTIYPMMLNVLSNALLEMLPTILPTGFKILII